MLWKKIEDYDYSVSKNGEVRNDKTGRLLKLQYNKKGYQLVGLYKNGKFKLFQVHRLVAEAFIHNPENKPCVDHINTIRDDNRIENLCWCTYKENNNNPLTKKNHKKHKRSRKIILLNTTEVFDYIREASEKYNVTWTNISKCCRGERKSAGKHPETGEKLVWMYLEDYKELE